MNLDKELSPREQKEVIEDLLGFSVIVEDDRALIIDEEGYEFYGMDANCAFDLSTMRGIIKYIEHISLERGIWKAKAEMREALGVE